MQHVGTSTTQRRQAVYHNATEYEAHTKCNHRVKGDPLRSGTIYSWRLFFTGKEHLC